MAAYLSVSVTPRIGKLTLLDKNTLMGINNFFIRSHNGIVFCVPYCVGGSCLRVALNGTRLPRIDMRNHFYSAKMFLGSI